MSELAQLFEFHGAVASLAVEAVNAPRARSTVGGVLGDHADQAWVAQNIVAEETAARLPADEEEARVRREILVRSALCSDRIDDVNLQLAAELRASRSWEERAVLSVIAGRPLLSSGSGCLPDISLVSPALAGTECSM